MGDEHPRHRAVLAAAAAIVATLGTRPGGTCYAHLAKPTWQPPAAAFPAVWTPLYVSVGWATGRAADSRAEGRGRYLALVGADPALNAGWCWAFFAGQSTRGGLATILALDAANLALLRATAERDRKTALALAPYLAWSGFATASNAAHVRLNP